MSNKKQQSNEFYKEFYDKNRVPLLQYKSLRTNFKKMVDDVLGKDYFNSANDVYESDKCCCEDITYKSKGFFEKFLHYLKS